eukprot:CAMPEP_0196573916 /NCGR_PEP_ID=MMETSP1081-20130531/3730_1 /TAXON_ID=36882 /ORGANISM="Pyramimonas amylifera, Strain CCMP720" /LENGTH=478 /DNA_ID=CAMNT_0041891771 /DNA_START=260 /DNA_END=1696 /DNA_ORIENTATION=+
MEEIMKTTTDIVIDHVHNVKKGTIRVKRIEKPDRAVLDSQNEKLQAQIALCQARIQEIGGLIENKKNGRKHVSAGGQLARNRLMELRSEFKGAMDAKNAIRGELAAVDAARDKLKDEAKAIKDKLSFVRVEHIDEEIMKLEGKIAHTTMSLDEERRTVDNIKQLRKSRDMVKVYMDRQGRIQEDDSHRRALIERIREVDATLNELKFRENEQRQVLEVIRSKEEAEVADIPELMNERNESYEVIREARDAARQLKIDFKQQNDEYYVNERLWQQQQREDRQRLWEANQAERKERDDRRKAWEAENAPEPFVKEVTDAEQLLGYLSKFIKVETVAVDSAPQQKAEFEGKQALKRGDEEVLDSFWAGLGGGKKGKGKSGGGKKESKKEIKEPKLPHTLDALASFSNLKMTPPLTKSDIPASIEILKEKKEHFLKKRQEVNEKKAQEPEEGAKKERKQQLEITIKFEVSDDNIVVILVSAA